MSLSFGCFDFPAAEVKRCTPAPPGLDPLSTLEWGNKSIVVK